METIHITKSQLREFLIYYQGLSTQDRFKEKSGIKTYFERVGCVQYDPLNVVGRNADLTLQSRIDGYSQEMLTELLYEDRLLIDGWDKMMSIYNIEDWINMGRVRTSMVESVKRTLKNRKALDALKYLDQVKAELAEIGPARSTQIDIGQTPKGSWGHGKLSSVAMDYMFHNGELGIKNKISAHKVYDLIENLIPNDILNQPELFQTDEEFYAWYVKRRIGSIGIYWDRNGGGWLGQFVSKKAVRTKAFNNLLENEEIVQIKVEGFKENFFIRTDDVDMLTDFLDCYNTPQLSSEDHEKDACKKEVRFIAPLDNLMWDRKFIQDVFDFEYVWEVYKPVIQRKYGYYVLPVLYGNQFIARFEPEHIKGGSELIIKDWWWEEQVDVTDEMIKAVIDAFEKFKDYLNADKISENIYELLRWEHPLI